MRLIAEPEIDGVMKVLAPSSHHQFPVTFQLQWSGRLFTKAAKRPWRAEQRHILWISLAVGRLGPARPLAARQKWPVSGINVFASHFQALFKPPPVLSDNRCRVAPI